MFDNPILLLSLAASALASVLASTFLFARRNKFRAGFSRTLELQAARLAEQAELLDLANDAILVWALQSGAIRFWNRGAQELYGWTSAEALGRTPQAVLQTRFPRPLAEINAELTS